MTRLGAVFLLCCSFQSVFAEESLTNEEIAALFDAPVEQLKAQYEQAIDLNEKVITGILYGYRSFDSGSATARAIWDELGDTDSYRGDIPEETYWALHNFYGWVAAREGKLPLARSHCTTTLNNIQAIAKPVLKYSVYSCNSFVAIRSGHIPISLKYASQARDQASLGGSRLQYFGGLTNEALLLYYSQLYDRAMENYELLTAMQDQVDPSAMRIVRFNLGLVYLEVGEAEKALEEFVIGTQWTAETGQIERGLIAHTQKAHALNALQRYEEAVMTLDDWLASDTSQFTSDTFSHALQASATAHLALGNYEQALEQSTHGYNIADQGDNHLRKSPLALLRARTLVASGDADGAFSQVEQTIAEHRDHGDQTLADALQLFAELALARGDHKSAYRALSESAEVSATNNRDELTRRVSMLDSIHELETTRRQLAVVAANAERDAIANQQRITIMISTFVVGLIILIALWLLQERRAQRREILAREEQSHQLEKLVAERTQALETRVAEAMQQKSQLEELQVQLTEAEKLRALGTLTGGVAHDFNNLLSVIVGSAGLLELASDLDDETARHVRSILNAAESGSRITNSLLSYARQQPLNPIPLDFAESLQNSLSMFQQSLTQGKRLETTVKPGIVLVDRGALNSAILNLVINAGDASEPNAVIRINAYPNTIDDSYVVEIIDEGEGMDEEAMEKAFEPFYSTKSSTRSTGLGLSMVHGFAHQSGGDIAIESQKGLGTTIRMTLPLCHSSELTRSAEPATTRNLVLNILCVDDNPDVLQVLCGMLESQGHQVTGCTSTQEALTELNSATWDLLISDVVLPGDLSGIELADQVSQRYPELKILLVSGYAEITSTDYCLLPKPFSTQTISNQIEKIFT